MLLTEPTYRPPKNSKKAIFPSSVHDFFESFLNRLFEFSILLRRGPGLGPGDRARAWAGACEEGWKMFFCQHGFFKPYGPQKAIF